MRDPVFYNYLILDTAPNRTVLGIPHAYALLFQLAAQLVRGCPILGFASLFTLTDNILYILADIFRVS